MSGKPGKKTVDCVPIAAFGELEPLACDLTQMAEVSSAFIDDAILVKEGLATIIGGQKKRIMFCLYNLEQRSRALRVEVYRCIEGRVPED